MLSLPTIPRRHNKILISWMLAYQHVCISCICAPVYSAVKQLLIYKAWYELGNCLFNSGFWGIRVCICWVLGVGSRHRDRLGWRGAVGLVLFKAREAREFVADFGYTIFVLALVTEFFAEEGCLLGRLEEEAIVTIIYYWRIFILSFFSGCEWDIGEYPGL